VEQIASKVINTILNLKDNFSKTISKTSQSTKKFQRQIRQAENQAAKMKKGITGAFSSTAAKVTGLIGGIGLATFAKDSLMLASDLGEVQNVVDTTFGNMAKKIDDFAKTTSSKFGISELQAKKYSGTLGAIMKSSGLAGGKLTEMSTGLTGLAGDMASFYNLEPDEAFEKLKSAISGETEPMKALGVNMSVANMEAFALSKGVNKAWKEMSQAEQTTLRYQYLMENTADSQGDYAKTNKSFANSLRTLKLNFQTLGAKIMANAIPPLEKLFGKINDFITKVNIEGIMAKIIPKIQSGFSKIGSIFRWLGNNMEWIKPIIIGVASAFGAFMIITKVTSAVSGLKKAFKSLKAGTTILSNPIFLVAAAIGALIAIGIILYKKSETFRNFIDGLFEKLKGFASWLASVLPPILQAIGNWFTTNILPFLQKLWELITIIWQNVLVPFGTWLASVFGVIFQTVFPIIANIVTTSFNSIKSVIEGVITFFGGVIDFVVGVFTGNWALAWEGVKEIFRGIFNSLVGIAKAPLNLIIDAINWVISKINTISIDIPDWVPEFGGKTFGVNIPTIPNFALGTQYFKGGLAQINEKGGEIVNLPNGAQVIPADKSEKMLKGGVAVYITIQGNVIGNEEYANYVGNVVSNKVLSALGNM